MKAASVKTILLRAGFLLLATAIVLPANALEEVKYIHTDALGTPIAATDENGNVIERYEYEPYGLQVSGPVEDGPGYTGHVEDTATGLTYMQQRYYEPGIGMFLSVDPVTAYSSPVGQFNRYRYANGNPYSNIDPDGRNAIRAGQFVLRGSLMIGAAGYSMIDDDLQALLPDPTSAPSAAEVIVVTMVSEALDVMAGAKILNESADQADNSDAAPSEGGVFETETITRKKPGADGATSKITLEKVDGETTSRTHTVTKDGEVIHQHQEHMGKHGSEQRFSDELTGTETINAD